MTKTMSLYDSYSTSEGGGQVTVLVRLYQRLSLLKQTASNIKHKTYARQLGPPGRNQHLIYQLVHTLARVYYNKYPTHPSSIPSLEDQTGRK